MKKPLCILMLAFTGCATQTPVEPPPNSIPRAAVSSASGLKSPQFEITMPIAQRPGNVPITYTSTRTLFAWRPLSLNVPPKQVRWIIVPASEFGGDFPTALDYIRTHPADSRWSSWLDYQAGHQDVASWDSPPLADGRYVFAVQGRSLKGLIDEEFDTARNVRFLEVVDYIDRGPIARVSGTFVESFETTGWSAPVRVHVPSGAPMQFMWTADGSYLGTSIAAYRYGWDIVDLNDDSLWEIPLTPYDGSCQSGPPRTWYFGTHTFTLEVRDGDGNRTQAAVTIETEQAESFNPALDIKPGDCENVLNARSKGRFTAVLAGTPPNGDLDGFDASTVDPETVVLGAFGLVGAVAPVEAHFADVVTAGAPSFCDCLDATPDGRLDLVLTFETDAVIGGLDPAPHSNSTRLLWCFGEMDHPEWGRVPFQTANCVNIVGFSETGGCRPPLQGPIAKGGQRSTTEAP